ncbi:FG-GAP-like repeat-containing protein [Streptomyces sp. NPDC056361]|uniref:FG-GAP-like repeat-containing protein n=1 Tax=Streptomyces sp. NPDC056361 TaxID=3345795 RepID=UPI0035D6B81C
MTRSTRLRGRRRALGAALAVLASSAALTTATTAPAQAAEGPSKPRLVFTEYKDVDGVGQRALVTVNADGTDRRVLTPTGPGLNAPDINEVVFSPDGTHIAFINSDNHSIWIADADGRNARLVHQGFYYPEGRPNDMIGWTPDGRALYFGLWNESYPHTDTSFMMRVGVDGSGLDFVFDQARLPGAEFDVAWDGRIAFGTNTHISVWDPRKGGEPEVVADGYSPTFSPTDGRIAFRGSQGGIRVLDAGGEYTLSEGVNASQLDWSPDGSQLVYTESGGDALYVVSATTPGATPKLLSAPGTRALAVSWAPPRGWNPHGSFRRDYGGDGRPDLLAAGTDGVLWRYDGNGTGGFQPRQKTGWGWKGYRFTAAGDLNGDGRPDALAQDATGGLWRLDGTTGGGFAPKVKVGTGWKDFKVTGVGDLTEDGYADILAVDAVGAVWQYPGDGRGGLQARQRVGTGYTGQRLTGVGAFTSSGYQNHLGLFPDGTLYRYERGAAYKVGWGWKGLTLTGAGDLSGDGVTDVLALDTNGVLWRYDGDGKGGMKPRIKAGWGWKGLNLF